MHLVTITAEMRLVKNKYIYLFTLVIKKMLILIIVIEENG